MAKFALKSNNHLRPTIRNNYHLDLRITNDSLRYIGLYKQTQCNAYHNDLSTLNEFIHSNRILTGDTLKRILSISV